MRAGVKSPANWIFSVGCCQVFKLHQKRLIHFSQFVSKPFCCCRPAYFYSPIALDPDNNSILTNGQADGRTDGPSIEWQNGPVHSLQFAPAAIHEETICSVGAHQPNRPSIAVVALLAQENVKRNPPVNPLFHYLCLSEQIIMIIIIQQQAKETNPTSSLSGTESERSPMIGVVGLSQEDFSPTDLILPAPPPKKEYPRLHSDYERSYSYDWYPCVFHIIMALVRQVSPSSCPLTRSPICLIFKEQRVPSTSATWLLIRGVNF